MKNLCVYKFFLTSGLKWIMLVGIKYFCKKLRVARRKPVCFFYAKVFLYDDGFEVVDGLENLGISLFLWFPVWFYLFE